MSGLTILTMGVLSVNMTNQLFDDNLCGNDGPPHVHTSRVRERIRWQLMILPQSESVNRSRSLPFSPGNGRFFGKDCITLFPADECHSGLEKRSSEGSRHWKKSTHTGHGSCFAAAVLFNLPVLAVPVCKCFCPATTETYA